jgi:hypothetical protein
MPRKEPRDYKAEYRDYHGTDEQIENRSSRNKSVRKLGREGKSRRDGKEVDHVDGNPKNRSGKNLKVISRTANRRKGG